MSKIRLQKCPLTLVNNYTSSRGHDDPNKEATVVVECSKDHAPRGAFGFVSFSGQRRSGMYLFFYLLLQSSLFLIIVLANGCYV